MSRMVVATVMFLCLVAGLWAARDSFENWYHQANFYNSNESRVLVNDPQSNQLRVYFQVTPEYESTLGQQSFSSIVTQGPQVQDAELTGYLQSLVSRLTSKTPGPNFAYKLTVLDAPTTLNAVTVPGSSSRGRASCSTTR